LGPIDLAAAPVYGMTPERITASTAILVALIGAIIGGMALVRSVRRGAVVALVLAPIGLIVGALVVATAKGGVGTGHGLAGGVVAIIVGLIGTALGGMALARSSRAA